MVKTNPNPNPFLVKIGFVKSRGVGFRSEPKVLFNAIGLPVHKVEFLQARHVLEEVSA